jgi:aminoglycoside/choline kinase family phosphotransferase
MIDDPSIKDLTESFAELTGAPPTSITPLKPHASERRIYRLCSASDSFIGVINPITPENECFIAFAQFFKQHGLPVPDIHLYNRQRNLYIEDDLGDETLFDYLQHTRKQSDEAFPKSAQEMYQRVLDILPQFQIECAKHFDFSKCYPEQHLLPGTFSGDCAQFATELVARILPEYDTTALTKDFALLIDFLGQADPSFFVYRDFQSRNIMIKDGKPFFIDFQSGRQGALQYDVVSLLYQASTKLPQEARQALAEHYCKAANRYTTLHPEHFLRYYSAFIVCRMLQVLGVYGKQGLGAGKQYFANSIEPAIHTLANELASTSFPIKTPHLIHCIQALQESTRNTQGHQ